MNPSHAALGLTRRVLFRRTLQVAGAIAAWRVTAPAVRTALATEVDSTSFALGARELSILEAVAETIVPSGGPFAVGAREVGLATRLDRLAQAQGPDVVQGLRGALWLVELGGGLSVGRAARFSSLSAEERERVLAALSTSRIALARDVFTGLKQLTVFGFYAAEASWPATGYDGPWVRGKESRA